MSDPALIGAFIGLAIGVVDFFILGYVRGLMGCQRPGAGMALNVARVSQLILFPIVGWFAGPVVASNMGG